MRPVELASWRKDGIDYQWVLLRRIKPWIQDNSRLPVGFRVYTRSEWQKSLKSAGKSWHLSNVDVLTLDVPTEGEGLEAILADVHEQTLSIGGGSVRRAPSLFLKSVPFTKQEIERAVASGRPRSEAERLSNGRSSTPENITLDEWMREVHTMIAD